MSLVLADKSSEVIKRILALQERPTIHWPPECVPPECAHDRAADPHAQLAPPLVRRMLCYKWRERASISEVNISNTCRTSIELNAHMRVRESSYD